ncbi:AAA-domain-containing protein [Choiromyces venosus 120613-1]|uniref:AAA-domain-containing protein n=1 Tax=Choiromyces venosus 120613-1 TaxID=1336337 RepID=A0A3N4K5V9_9PEZI|nr:AAA-domain-containing protein [Choiromyces venosus 120613-1]
MVQLPLTYPELFLAKKITPPRGVLFHGPPGTGKTLMARALAASCSTETRKVTFYMRKGADCLSKWVGEAERQLRLLFEEAKNNQPSIIFFDEIDGLAPVRSSKQDQIHASIVSTMLALMDGMDGRGQVVVIGATNRPDAVDPALRRPGRFDREFYFPLPAMTARKSIIDIHTRGWSPALPEALKDGLAFQTKGYGGADLRIYMTSDKLALDPDSIHVTARDFMLAMKKVVPSSQRSSSSGTDPLPSYIEPLLSGPLEQLKKCMEGILPERKRLTVLEEAMYEDDHDSDGGFSRENMMQDFDQARVFRPRMLIHGASGMGQQYLAGALLNYFEKLHVQAFDLATLVGDSTRSVETAIVQLFVEVKRHKPSVMFIPDVDTWYSSISGQGLITFKSLLRSIPANDPVLLLGVTNSEIEDVDPTLLQDLFGFSKRDRFRIPMPNDEARWKYFDRLIAYIQKAPNEFPPDPSTRRKRELPVLPVVPPPPPRAMTKEERKAQDAKDKQIKNWLKMRLFYAIDTVRSKLRRFKKPILDYEVIKHLFEEPDVAPDLATQGPANNYQLLLPKDIHSPPKVLDTSTGKSFYNMDMDVIEERVSNGYYCSARQFLRDVEYIRDDWMELGHKEHRMRVNELLTHLEVIATDIEAVDPAMAAQCAELWSRERKKMEERAEKAERQKRAEEEARLEAQKARASLDRQTPSVERQLHAGSDKSQERPTPTNATGNDGDVSVNISASAVISTAYPPSNGIGRYTHMSSSLEVQASQVSQNDDFTNTGTSSRQGSPAALHSPPPSQHTQSSEHASAFQTAISSIPANSSRSLAVAAANEIPQMISQPGAALGIAPVTGLSAIMNYASTTTSGKRTSDGTAGLNSQPFSHPYSNSNGTPRPMNPPLFHNFGGISTGDSQLPDTQVVPSSSSDSGPSQTSTSAPHSQPSNASSQSHHHHLHNSNSHSNSNNHNDSTFSHPAPPFFALPPLQTTITCDSSLLANLHKRLVAGTARYTVEQLEQVNSACMSKVWEMRACWNRNEVMREVSDVFDEVDGDIRERAVGDGIGDGSFGSA